MSTESEVTFIRCPSCRSLIPASSSKCRMCGVALEGAQKEVDEAKSKGRVRQHTSSEINEKNQKKSGSQEDPFEKLLDDVDDESLSEDDDDEEDLFDTFDDDEEEEEDDFEDTEKPSPVKNTKALAIENNKDPLAEFINNSDEEELESKPRDVIKSKVTKKDDKNNSTESNQQKKKRTYKGFAKKFVTKSRVSRDKQKADEVPHLNLNGNGKIKQLPEKIVEEVKIPQSFDDKPKITKPVDVIIETEPVTKTATDIKGWVRKPSKEMTPAEVATVVGHTAIKTVQGRLFGWFVNYGVPEGVAIELREGRAFISNTKLKPTDIVINDPSVSTPHALIIVSGQGGLIVQDLMSDRGVFKRSVKGSSYTREHDPIALRHGDWIRFGDVEFMVAIIPYIGQVEP